MTLVLSFLSTVWVHWWEVIQPYADCMEISTWAAGPSQHLYSRLLRKWSTSISFHFCIYLQNVEAFLHRWLSITPRDLDKMPRKKVIKIKGWIKGRTVRFRIYRSQKCNSPFGLFYRFFSVFKQHRNLSCISEKFILLIIHDHAL